MSWHTPKHWHSKNLLARLLYPAGALFFAVQGLNYLRRGFKPYRAPIPVISIGNLTAGGSGKTPVALNLARFLSQQGETVALISHGYGSTATQPVLVTADSDPRVVGDEAIEMAQAYAAAQVWSGGERRDCCMAAVEAEASVLILDDAFSNPSIVRDLDLLVVDSLFGFGNGWPLPAGPMREPFSAQHRAAAAIVLQQGKMTKRLDDIAIPQVLVHVEAAATLPHRPLVAFCGLGLPDKFYAHLRAQGLRLAETVNFPDHHDYTEKDLEGLRARAKSHNAVLVTTAKDAVKLPRDFIHEAPVYVAQQQFNCDTKAGIATTLAIFGAFTEGLQLFASFAILLNFPRQNKMRGMGQIITWSVRDETLHTKSIIKLYHTFLQENPEVNTSKLQKDLIKNCHEVIKNEDAFIDLAFEMGDLEGLTADEVKQYIRYIADRRLGELNLPAQFFVAKNPLPWLDEMLNGVEHTNFFENRSTEYSKAATKGDWEEVFAPQNFSDDLLAGEDGCLVQ